MRRRCVICGNEATNNECGRPTYHYPRTRKEARIWKRSMKATNIPLDSIKKYCCVCIDHIPEFVERTRIEAARIRCCGSEPEAEEEGEEEEEEEKKGDCCCNPNAMCNAPYCPIQPAVNVLLMTGATLPTYCSKSCEMAAKSLNETGSDTDICVLESTFTDGGAIFPDIDGTEYLVMRTPTQDDEELEAYNARRARKAKKVKLKKGSSDDSDDGTTDVSDDLTGEEEDDECLADCTDVLVLGRGHHPTDDCPCNCDICTKPQTPEDAPCCGPPCCPQAPPQPPLYEQPPCGCECEQQVRREMGRIINNQQQRIQELEDMLCRQNHLHQTLQCKMDDLYSEFDRVEGDCPKQDCVEPDCRQRPVRAAAAPVERQRKDVEEKPEPMTKREIKEMKRKKNEPPKEQEEPKVEEEEDEHPFRKVQYYLGKNPKAPDKDCTRNPSWIQKRDEIEAEDYNPNPEPEPEPEPTPKPSPKKILKST